VLHIAWAQFSHGDPPIIVVVIAATLGAASPKAEKTCVGFPSMRTSAASERNSVSA